MFKITEAQIYLTRDCNLKCGYCKLVKSKIKDIPLLSWKIAYDNMERIGIETVKIMGGEPTLKKWLPDLLRYSLEKGIKTAVLSNSTFSDKTADTLAESGLWGYFASVDSLEDLKIDISTSRKSRNGYGMLRYLQRKGVPLLAANVVIHRFNMHEIPDLVNKLSKEGFYVNLCTIQHTTNPNKEFSDSNMNRDYLIPDNKKDDFILLSEKLLELKRLGLKISVPDIYLKNMPVYGIKNDWQCTNPLQLRIDSDGGLMLCNEFRTELADKYNIVSLTPDKYRSFSEEWKAARKSINCDGCYWSSFIQAEDNLKHNRLEFQYSNIR